VIFRGQKIQLTAVKVLIAINVLVFIFTSFFGGENGTGVDNFLGLSWRGISNGNLWQVFTYQFVHAGSMHLLLNMVGLWFTGPVLERLMGVYRFVAFYLIAGAVGGLLHMLIPPGGSLVGASGSICGLVAAFSALFPRMPITALLFFVIPVRMEARWLGFSVVMVSLFLLVTGLFGNIGNAAHLGGALAGYAWVRFCTPRFRVMS
jgi:membrane associated rhomboid family serine protease